MDNTVKKTVDNLAETLGRAGLGDRGRGPYPEQLLFKPPLGSKASQSLGDIPNYLFRVVSPKSAGKTNRMWARSESARQHEISSTKDIFSFKGPEDRQTKAFELTVHLQWYGDIYEAEDNFVSWTSSLLFAIQYIYYRHHHDIPGPSLNDIQLYVIDTSLFPRGTFMRDLDLIESFREFDRENTSGQYWNLKSLHSLRTTKGFYFGEYLSQGSLKIENKCRKIPAKILFDNNRLRRLQPAFNKLYMPPPCRKDTKWAKAVIDVRKAIWPPILPVLSSLEISDRLAALKEILDTMDTYDSQHGWTFPLGIYLAALAGFGPATDTHTESCGLFFEKFQSATWGGKLGLRYSRHQDESHY
jgi:hypothetical protein